MSSDIKKWAAVAAGLPAANMTPIVIDNGTGLLKAGFASQEAPQVVFPSMVGRPRHLSSLNVSIEDTMVGEVAARKRGILSLRYPIERGVVTNWNDMELIWQHTYELLRADPSDQPVVLTEPPLNPAKNREKMTEVMFELFQVPALYVATQAVLSLYANGGMTGVVLDAGDGVTNIVPIYEGYGLTHTYSRVDLVGKDLTDYLSTLLSEQGVTMSSPAERDSMRDIKEKLCYVSLDYERDMALEEPQTAARPREEAMRVMSLQERTEVYKLPDGKRILLGSERFRCPEPLFHPSLLGKDEMGLHEAIHHSIQLCDMDLHKRMYANIILSGGTTMFPNLEQRVRQELTGMVSPFTRIKVTARPDRKFSAWNGGAVLASLPGFKNMSIATKEYDEVGPSIVHRKCF